MAQDSPPPPAPTYSEEDMKRIRAAFKQTTGQDMTAEAIGQLVTTPLFARPGEATELARLRIPEAPSAPETAYQIFHDEAMLDGNARLIFAFGATLARVAVNRVTGQVRMLDVSQHTAAGPVLDHAAYLGQIEGASCRRNCESCRRWESRSS